MKVQATQFGFYLKKRKEGDVFDFEGRPSLKWMAPVDDVAKKAFAKLGWKAPPTPPPAPPVDEKVKPEEKDPKGTGGSTGDRNVI